MDDMKGGALFGIKDEAKLRLVKIGWRKKSPGKNTRLGSRTICIDDMGADDFCNGALATIRVMAL